jgi:hypothetical protein
MNPNGTGRLRAVISHRFAPLLPNKVLSFALPSENSQTDFCMLPLWIFPDYTGRLKSFCCKAFFVENDTSA